MTQIAGKDTANQIVCLLKTPKVVQIRFAAEKTREKINRGQQGQLTIPSISLLEWHFLHHLPFLGIFNTFISWIAITGLVLIKVMVTSANCLSISTHWHQFTPWWLFKKRGYQGVTGIRRFTWYCSDLTWITFPGLLLLVTVILA